MEENIVATPDGSGTASESGPGYFTTRFTRNDGRGQVWRHICDFLQTWIAGDADVLELGAGWCDFSNAVHAGSVTAMDIDPVVQEAAGPAVAAVVGDCTDLSRFRDGSFDCVVASNLLEHLTRPMADTMLAEAQRVLRPGGRLLLIQPNFRLNPREYFDDYTHVSIYTDRSLRDYLAASGWSVDHVAARFLPLSMKSRGSGLTFLVPWYLRSPIKPFAGQMLVVASRGAM
ncbi:class I SAM-dependent methyltransferase [Nakamurella sp. UYEF19]|uniref:class I SAM-dependent methyltransferase n=1 Tax=Nakamurella sp. UYEF19 TaxID=1756392 RepID=UPI00339B6ABA